VTASVVDLDGVRQAILRGNGAPIHTLDNAHPLSGTPPSYRLSSITTASAWLQITSGFATPASMISPWPVTQRAARSQSSSMVRY
jgi:hypothetical protein